METSKCYWERLKMSEITRDMQYSWTERCNIDVSSQKSIYKFITILLKIQGLFFEKNPIL
jgi:hypothetical protein